MLRSAQTLLAARTSAGIGMLSWAAVAACASAWMLSSSAGWFFPNPYLPSAVVIAGFAANALLLVAAPRLRPPTALALGLLSLCMSILLLGTLALAALDMARS